MPSNPVWRRSFERLRDEYHKESDRAAAVLAAAFLDAALEDSLTRYFVNDTRARKLVTDGALQHFSVRVDIAFALGLLDRGTADDLNTIGRIRNKFSHSHAVNSFNHLKVVEQCRNLRFAQLVPKKFRKMKAGFNEPRAQYLFSVYACLAAIDALAKKSRRRRAPQRRAMTLP